MTKGELTRQHIIEKAAPVFNQRGFAGCSMHHLMEATGLEKGGLYRHFASKEELAVEAFKFAMEQVITARIGDLEKVTGAISRMMQVVQSFVQRPSPVAGGCPLMNVAADADTGCQSLKREAKHAIGLWKSKLCKILAEGAATGELRGDIDPQKTANTVISMLEGALVISRLEGNQQAMFDAQDSLATLFEGLRSSNAATSIACPSVP